MTSGKIDVNGNSIWYEKFGNGPHVLLFIPGAIGTGRSDFLPQLQGNSAFDFRKFTIVTIELLGWGRSRPPSRKYDLNIYNNDVECCYKLMEALGYSCYSVLGWSDGAKTALIMAIRYPARIKSCIVWGIVTSATEEDIKSIMITRNIKYWGSDMIDSYYKVYGNEWQTLWNNHMDFLENIIEIFPNGFLNSDLAKCRCPVMILHGDHDPIVDLRHAEIVLKNVSDSRLIRFPNGSHNLHITGSLEFKKLVEDFLDECDEGF